MSHPEGPPDGLTFRDDRGSDGNNNSQALSQTLNSNHSENSEGAPLTSAFGPLEHFDPDRAGTEEEPWPAVDGVELMDENGNSVLLVFDIQPISSYQSDDSSSIHSVSGDTVSSSADPDELEPPWNNGIFQANERAHSSGDSSRSVSPPQWPGHSRRSERHHPSYNPEDSDNSDSDSFEHRIENPARGERRIGRYVTHDAASDESDPEVVEADFYV